MPYYYMTEQTTDLPSNYFSVRLFTIFSKRATEAASLGLYFVNECMWVSEFIVIDERPNLVKTLPTLGSRIN